MARQEVRLIEYNSYYDEDGNFQLCAYIHCDVLDIPEITANEIQSYLNQCACVPPIKTELIEEWLKDPVNPLFVGHSPNIDDHDLTDHHELDIINYIQPPFGPLGGKRIILRD